MDARALFATLAQWGDAFTPQMIAGTQALFAPLVNRPTEASVVRDVAYGEHERQRCDIFRPDEGTAPAPVLVFVHGGGFVMGDKGAADAPFHNNIGAWAARQGYVGVTMSYRLAPAFRYPSGAEDVAQAVRFLRGAVAAHGGDPDRIFVMGQSAGATHVSTFVADETLRAAAPIAGALMISGVYDVARADRNPFQKAYYGDDVEQWGDYASLPGLVATDLPCFYSVSQYDPIDFQRQASWVVDASLAQNGRWPAMHWLRGHNHLSSVSQIGSAHDTLGPLIAAWIGSIDPPG